MGISRFYRWLSERYPLVNETITRQQQVPPFDNFYLDLNGIVHHCAHGNQPENKWAENEDELWISLFHYISELVHLIRPKRLLYLAVDGVAPRAKMNQQRCRRFRSAQERQDATTANIQNGGERGPDFFDVNCITPGTEFMDRLIKHLNYFVHFKIETDPLWQSIRVVLSGPDVPGEGEHKIMDYIRKSKSVGTPDPNTRHCLYGLDADLIMLALASHEPHFALFREEVKFGTQIVGERPEERLLKPTMKFQLLHIGVLREYLKLDFERAMFDDRSEGLEDHAFLPKMNEKAQNNQNTNVSSVDANSRPPFKSRQLDLERLIDDLILVWFLAGNDFLPHLPFTDIASGGMNEMLKVYNQYLNGENWLTSNCGMIDWTNFQSFLSLLGRREVNELSEKIDEALYLLSKKGGAGSHAGRSHHGSHARGPRTTANDSNMLSVGPSQMRMSSLTSDERSVTSFYGKAAAEEEVGSCLTAWDTENPPRSIDEALEQYYFRKMKLKSVKDLCLSYLRGLQWNLFYYYRSVPSWSYYFDFHYPPFVLSLLQFGLPTPLNSNHFSEFNLGEPFTPFEQLMSVLPSLSCDLVPPMYRPLMINNSPIKKFYPDHFIVDMEAVKVPWGGVAILPFIDQNELLKEMRKIEENRFFSIDEKRRNQTGDAFQFQKDKGVGSRGQTVISTLPRRFQDLTNVKVRKDVFIHPQLPPSAMNRFPTRPLPGALSALPEFPSLHRMQIEEAWTDRGLVIFNNTVARQPGIHLKVKSKEGSGAETLFKEIILSPIITFGYPFQKIGRVSGVYIGSNYYKVELPEKAASEASTLALQKMRRHKKPKRSPPSSGTSTPDPLYSNKENCSFASFFKGPFLKKIKTADPSVISAYREYLKKLKDSGLEISSNGVGSSSTVDKIVAQTVLSHSFEVETKPTPAPSPADEEISINDIFFEVDAAEEILCGSNGKIHVRFGFNSENCCPWAGVSPASSFLGRNAAEATALGPLYKCDAVTFNLTKKQLKTGMRVICLDSRSILYGCVGQIKQPSEESPVGSTKCAFKTRSLEPAQVYDLQAKISDLVRGDEQFLKWFNFDVAARRVGCPASVVQRLTRSVLVSWDKARYDIGLNLVSSVGGRVLCLPTYARYVKAARDASRLKLLLSNLAVTLLCSYAATWPSVVAALDEDAPDETKRVGLKPSTLFPHSSRPQQDFERLIKWCQNQPFSQLRMSDQHYTSLTSKGVRAIESLLDGISEVREYSVSVIGLRSIWPVDLSGSLPDECLSASSSLYKSTLNPRWCGYMSLGQRVIYAIPGPGGRVPLGSKGTVIGLTSSGHEQLAEVLMDEPFITGSDLHGRCSQSRGLVVPTSALIKGLPTLRDWGLDPPTLSQFHRHLQFSLKAMTIDTITERLPLPDSKLLKLPTFKPPTSVPASVIVPVRPHPPQTQKQQHPTYPSQPKAIVTASRPVYSPNGRRAFSPRGTSRPTIRILNRAEHQPLSPVRRGQHLLSIINNSTERPTLVGSTSQRPTPLYVDPAVISASVGGRCVEPVILNASSATPVPPPHIPMFQTPLRPRPPQPPVQTQQQVAPGPVAYDKPLQQAPFSAQPSSNSRPPLYHKKNYQHHISIRSQDSPDQFYFRVVGGTRPLQRAHRPRFNR